MDLLTSLQKRIEELEEAQSKAQVALRFL